MTRPARRQWWWWGAVAVAATAALLVGLVSVLRATRDFPSRAAPPLLNGDKPLAIAHRGASGNAPEHTLAAYNLARRAGADVLEIDLRMTQDGVVVVAHDATLQRLVGLQYAISELSLARLRQLTMERTTAAELAPIPTLEEIFTRFPETTLNLEIKQESPDMVEAVARLVDRFDRRNSIILASFHSGVMKRLRARLGHSVTTAASAREAAGFVLCYLTSVPCRPDYAVLQVPPQARMGPFKVDLANRDFINFAHRHGLKVHYWTIDDPARMAALLRSGADGIMSNYPARAVAAIHGRLQ
jgi:glycerophosphoryl diester phosphodiesterase